MRNQFYKIIRFLFLTICLGSIITTKAFSIENPGIIESLERLLDVHRKQYEVGKSKSQFNLKALSDISEFKDIKIDPKFMRELLFHSDDKFLKLAQKDECKFLSTLESNLLKTADGDIVNILINFKSRDNKAESTAVPKDDFFDVVYKKNASTIENLKHFLAKLIFKKRLKE